MTRHFIPLLLLALSLAGCSEVSQRGEQAALQLLAAWGNTEALRQVDRDYQQAADSLYMPGTKGQMASAFIRSVGERDSVRAVAQAIALNAEEFAQEHARPLVDALLNGTMDARQATDQLFLLHWAADILGKADHIVQLDQAIEEAANKLSGERQMLLYSKAATPAALAKQMRAERQQPGADTADIDHKAQLLEKIYNPEQLAEFQTEYNNQ